MRTHLLISSILCVASIAAAEPMVLAVEGKDVYIDLGARDGVGAGAELELWHEVVAKDPRTGATLRDRFALGTISVVKSGDKISIARAGDDLAKRVLAGDHVRLISAPRRYEDPWVAQVEASKAGGGTVSVTPTSAGTPGVDHLGLARQAWQDTLGQAPGKRIERWNALLAVDPKSPYRKVIENEIVSLRIQIQQRDEALARARSQDTGDRNPRIAHLASQLARATPIGGSKILAVAPLERAVPGRPIQLSFLVRMPSAIAQAWLYVRSEGEPGFKRTELVPDGDAYLRGTIESAAVRAGKLEWYVEAKGRGAEGDVAPVLGSQDAPEVIEIDDDVVEGPIEQGRSHIDAHVDYVDFDGKLATGFDQYYQAEIDFTYRFIKPVYAVRLGFGTLAGTGGDKDIIDNDPMDRCLDENGVYQCKQVSFSYVYTELEFRIRPNIALMVRPQAGLLTTDRATGMEAGRCKTDDITDCDFTTGFGMRGRVRFGAETATNLVIGAGFTDGVGTLLEAAYHWLPTQMVPVQLTVQVTDQPVAENLGVRLIADVGVRRLSWVYPSVRLSYQARDIDHAGVSGGFAMNFDW